MPTTTEIRILDRTRAARLYTGAIGLGSAVLAFGGRLAGGALGWFFAAFFALAAAACLYEALRPRRVLLGVDASGLTIADHSIPWDAVESFGRDPGLPSHEGDEPAPFVWVRIRADHPAAAAVGRWNRPSADPLVLTLDHAPSVSDEELLAAIARHR